MLYFANAAAGQQTPIEKLPEKGWFPSYRSMKFRLKTADSSTQPGASDQTGIYKMRQDGSPCIVPGTEGMPVMPNAFGTVRIKSKVKIKNLAC